MNAPTLTSATDLESGSSVRLALTPPAEAEYIVVHHKDVTSSAWSTSRVAAATSLDVTGLTEGKVYEFLLVAEDGSGAYSLPSRPLRCVPTTGEGSVLRRIEKNVVTALGTIMTVDGHFDDVDNVYRYTFPVDTVDESGFFIIAAFGDDQSEFAAHHGADVIDERTLDVFVGAGRKGRDGTSDWIPDSVHEMLASIQIALQEDPERGGLALNTEPAGAVISPEELAAMADAVAAQKFTITYRTYRSAPHSSAV